MEGFIEKAKYDEVVAKHDALLTKLKEVEGTLAEATGLVDDGRKIIAIVSHNIGVAEQIAKGYGTGSVKGKVADNLLAIIKGSLL